MSYTDTQTTTTQCPQCEQLGTRRRALVGYWCSPCNLVYAGSSEEWEHYRADRDPLKAAHAAEAADFSRAANLERLQRLREELATRGSK